MALALAAAALARRAGGSWLRLEVALAAAASLFMLFEAAAGWCAARACGLRTPY